MSSFIEKDTLVGTLDIIHLSNRPMVFTANCPDTVAVEEWVYITGPITNNLYNVDTADPTDSNKVPAVGIAIEKPTDTTVRVQWFGKLNSIVTGLTSGVPIFLGAGGLTSETPHVSYYQILGVTIDDEEIIVAPEYDEGSGLPSVTGNDGYALIEIGSDAQFRPIKESYIVPFFDIISFSITGGSVKEVGETINTPAFTASYNRTPTVATLKDNQANPDKDVSSTPTSFSSNYNFQKTVNNDTVQFTLEAEEDGEIDSQGLTVYWRPRTFYGVGVDGGNDEAFIEALANQQLDNNRNTTFTVTAGSGEHIYYAYPDAYGAATFTVGGFEGGFDLVSSTISVTNGFGVTQNYRLYKSTNPNLGTTTVTVT